ncbi:MAG: DUF2784 domain-containing protein [Pseudomonadota bacterium]
MIYRLLAHLTLLVHFTWILFLLFGFIFAIKRSRLVWLHLSGLLFALILNLMKWYCPLTYLENYLYSLHDVKSAYTGPFIINYVEKLVYPSLPEHYMRAGEICFVTIYIVIYISYFKRYRFSQHKRKG